MTVHSPGPSTVTAPSDTVAPPLYGQRIASWPRALGAPLVCGRIRTRPEDFRVDECAGFTPDGVGEHVVLQVRKRNGNTEWVARQLAAHAEVRPGDVGFAGLKDRAAVTTQWFSVYLPRQSEPVWSELTTHDLQVLQVARHGRKIRRGTLEGNRFRIVIRDLLGDTASLQARLERIRTHGVPNYFGEQRFGHGGHNLEHARALFQGTARRCSRHKRGLYLSAARSFLFNEVLARRIERGNWDRALPGDALMLSGGHSLFVASQPDADIHRRVAALDLHPTGPMWGRGRPMVRNEAAALENTVLAELEIWRDGLEHVGLKQQRRALRAVPGGLAWDWMGDDALELRFELEAGTYATAVLRELVDYEQPPL